MEPINGALIAAVVAIVGVIASFVTAREQLAQARKELAEERTKREAFEREVSKQLGSHETALALLNERIDRVKAAPGQSADGTGGFPRGGGPTPPTVPGRSR